MTQPSAIDVARAWVRAYNAKDWDALDRAITPDFVYDEVGTQRVIRGRADYLAASKGWAQAFPDSQGEFGPSYASGDKASPEVRWRGTHSGPLVTPNGAIPPTGRTIEVRACVVVTVADQKVRVARHYFDMVTMLSQIGVAAGV